MAKILLVTNIFPPEIGGPAAFIDRLAGSLAVDNQVTVVCSSDGIDPGMDDERPFRVRRVDMANRYRYEVEIRARLARELLVHDRILVNGLETYVSPIAKRLRRTFVLKVVGDPVWEWGRNVGLITETFDEFQTSSVRHPRLRALVEARRAYLAQAEIVITPSEYLHGIVAGWGVEETEIITIHNGVPPGTPIEPRPLSSGPSFEVLFCGRLTNWKGVEIALLAIKEVAEATLTVVGDGPELPLLRQLAAGLGLDDRVRFTGRLPRPEVDERMAAADVLVLASSYEGLSHTLLEACAHGLVPVVSDIGGNLEIVQDGVNGLTVKQNDVAAMVDAFRRLRDPGLRNELSAAAVATAARFPFEQVVEQFARVLRR